MELTVHLKVEVEDKVLETVKHAVDMLSAAKLACSSDDNFKSLTAALASEPAEEPAEAPSTAGAEQSPAEAAKPAPAPQEESEEITDDDMTDFIRVWKTRVKASEIKKVFAKYGCTSSTGCPQASRGAMMNDIKALANA